MAANATGGRFRIASPATANVLAVLGAALLIAAVPLTTVNHTLTDPRGGAIIPVLIAFGAVGLVVARRQPRNPVGWILLGFAVLMAASGCAGAYAAFIYRFGHGGLPLGPVAVLLALLWYRRSRLPRCCCCCTPTAGSAGTRRSRKRIGPRRRA